MNRAVLHKRLIVSPIWFLPLLALCIGIWLLFSSYQNSGIKVTLHFSGVQGVTAGKTKVIYKGIEVGKVISVEIDKALEGVNITVEMDRVTKKGLVADTMFWIVRPEISAGRISGLDTLVSGAYLSFRIGNSTKPERHFSGLSEPPPMGEDTPGLHIRLRTDTLYSLQRGSYVYSQNLRIGKVDDYHLEEDGSIFLDVFIQPEFRHLIQEGTRFWNASGLSVTGDLQKGLSINVESMASLIYGGLTCGTPASLKDTPPAQPHQVFPLYKDFAEAVYGIPMTLQLASGDGIVPGRTKVMFRGLKAGVVQSIDINDDDFHTVTARILLDPRAKKILRKGTRFWVVRPHISLHGIQNLETLISGSYITFQIGEGEQQDHFLVESSPMPKLFLQPGKRFHLTAEDGNSLRLGSPILYKQQKIGEIVDIQLNAKSTKNNNIAGNMAIELLIYEQYTELIKNNTRFYNVSGFQLDASLQGISLQTASLNSIITGGISFVTPKNGDLVPAEKIFPLYPGRAEALQADALFLTLEFLHGNDIKEKTKIKYKGITLGTLIRTWYDPQKDRVFAKAAVQQKFSKLFRQTTDIWLVQPKVHLTGVEHLETLLAGPYLELLPGTGRSRSHFTVKKSEPDISLVIPRMPGLHLVLEAERIGSLKKGSPIYYRQVKIGKIIGIELGPTAQMVWIHLVIEPQYTPLVSRNSKFWNAGGIKVIAGLFSGVSVETESLESIMAGGIAMATPEDFGTPAQEGDHFLMAKEADERWLAWSPKIFLKKRKGNGRSKEKK